LAAETLAAGTPFDDDDRVRLRQAAARIRHAAEACT
jgi:hypothetical protein